MINKKAFTIVEVLAVVVLLGVLAGIAMPIIQNYVNEAREEYNKQVENELLVSGKLYFSENKEKMPKLSYLDRVNLGEKKSYVTAPELLTQTYLKNDLVDYDGNNCDDSYVVVAKNTSSDEEIWHPCLICDVDGEKKVHSEYPYCIPDINWDDTEKPTCDIEVLSDVKGDHINSIFNANNVKFKFTALSDLPVSETGKNYSTIVFYNQTTNKFTYKNVSDMSEDSIYNMDLAGIAKDEGLYSIFVVDKGINKSDSCFTFTVDNTSPKCDIDLSPDDEWIKEATIKVNNSDGSEDLHETPYAIQKDDEEIDEYQIENTFTASKKGKYTAYIRDKAENEGTCSVDIQNIDSTPPLNTSVVSKFADGTGNYTSGNWAYKKVLTTLSYQDEESGVDHIRYRLEDSSEWNEFRFEQSPLEQSGTTWSGTEAWDVVNGRNQTYYFSACDKVGNCSKDSDEFIIKYDTTTPSVSLSAKKNKSGTSVASGSWSNEGLNFILTTSTVGSSGATIYYCKDTNNSCNPNNEVTSGSEITSYNTLNGTFYIRYKIVSGAGLSSAVKSYTAKVDTGVPSITITAKKSSSGTSVAESTWSNEGLNFILETDSTGTSGATIYYCKDTSNSCSPSTKATSGSKITSYNDVTGTFYIRYKVVSGTGISSSVGSYTAKVDTSKPTITYTANKDDISSKYVAPVKIEVTCSDSGGSKISTFSAGGSSVSGVSGESSASKTITISTIGTKSIAASCKDKAGNSVSTTKSFTTFEPVTSITISSIPSPLWVVVNGSDTVYNKSTAKVTVSPSDATNTGVTWKSSNTSVLTVSSSGVMTPKAVGSATITATAKDGTGEKASKTVYVYKAQTRNDDDISRATNGGTKYGKIVLTSHQVYATNGSGTVTLKVNGKHTTEYGTWLGTGSSASTSHCKSYARWICLTDSTSSPTGSEAIPYSACDSSLKLVKSRKTTWSNGSSFCDKTSLTMSKEGTFYIMLGGGVSVTSCTSCGTSSTKDFSSSGNHINAKFTKYSLKISK